MKSKGYARRIDVDYWIEDKSGRRSHRGCVFSPLDGNDVREIVSAFKRKDTARLSDNGLYKRIVSYLEEEGGSVTVRKVIWAD